MTFRGLVPWRRHAKDRTCSAIPSFRNAELSALVDKFGQSMRLKYHSGIYYPMHIKPENIDSLLTDLKDRTSRPDDVYIASYPKSGTNWVYTIVDMLLTGTTKISPDVNFNDKEYRKLFDNRPSPRLTASHFRFNQMPNDMMEKRVKIINVTRNPKDTAVSLYNFLLQLKQMEYKGSWDGFLDLFLDGQVIFGSWFEYVKDWENVASRFPNQILQIRYEDLDFDLRGNVQKIAAFLDVTCKESFLDGVTQKCSFENMKTASNCEDFWKVYASSGRNPIWRKGIVGDWKNWFTIAQSEEFDLRYCQEMKGTNIDYRFE